MIETLTEEERRQRAISRLACFMQGDPRLQGIVSTIVNNVSELETVLQDICTSYDLDTAADAALDVLGSIVGEPRAGRSDTDYRPAIRARILANKSEGSIEDMIAVMDALGDGMNTIQIVEWYPGDYFVIFPDEYIGDPSQLKRFSDLTDPAAVRGLVWYFETPTPFGFLGNPIALGFSAGGLAHVE